MVLMPGAWPYKSLLQSVWDGTARNHSCNHFQRRICCWWQIMVSQTWNRLEDTTISQPCLHPYTLPVVGAKLQLTICQMPPTLAKWPEKEWSPIPSSTPISKSPTSPHTASSDTHLDLVTKYFVHCPLLLNFTDLTEEKAFPCNRTHNLTQKIYQWGAAFHGPALWFHLKYSIIQSVNSCLLNS